MSFHVRVDQARCQGHARCLAFAPEVFDFDDEGYSFVPDEISHVSEVSENLRLAVSNCPERAILLEEEQHA